jgi:uncharacterized protein YukE
MLSIENAGVGRGGQEHVHNASAIKQRLMALMTDLEGSRNHWDGASGSAFVNAKNRLLEQFDGIFSSTGRIGEGLGQTQVHTNTADDTSHSDVAGSGAAVAGLNSITTINV